ncbi:TPA: hypothetical protein ACX6QL_001689 [Photobacterium damselae]
MWLQQQGVTECNAWNKRCQIKVGGANIAGTSCYANEMVQGVESVLIARWE